ncbi:MAG: patatin-like phospholipase family protein [Bacilli bacterium]
MKRAIVLSGGGAKGAYEIGVWKALRKLHVKYDIVTGSSVGALNGALMVQNSYFTACYLWNRMDFNLLFNENDLKEFSLKKDNLSLLKMYGKNILNGGMDVSDLEILVKKCLNPRKILKSKIEFGIITVNTKTLKPKIVKKNEIEVNKLSDYLIASASCYPVFKQKEIDKNHFMDGGFYDNMPVNLAIEMGADEIIAVNLDAIGMSRPVKNKNIPITYIRPHNKIGSFLMFEKEQAKRAIKFGYNDTLKTFNKLEGNEFTFYRKELSKNHDLYKEKLKTNLKNIFDFKEDKSFTESIMTIASYKRILSSKNINSIINDTLEYLAAACKADETKIYRVKDLHKQIITIMNETTAISLSNFKNLKLPGTKEIIKYFYNSLNQENYSNKQKRDLITLSIGFPKDFLSALYLYTIKQENK